VNCATTRSRPGARSGPIVRAPPSCSASSSAASTSGTPTENTTCGVNPAPPPTPPGIPSDGVVNPYSPAADTDGATGPDVSKPHPNSCLPGASSNLVADRLRELEARDVVHRRKLPAPAASWVYELTGRGRRLEAVLDALGEWGGDLARPPAPFALSATSVLLYLRGAVRPDPADPPAAYRLALGADEVWTVRTEGGRVHVEQGEPERADATISTDPHGLNDLLADPSTLDGYEVGGDREALRRLIKGRQTR
jgi:HxlR-like helix-turn-helix